MTGLLIGLAMLLGAWLGWAAVIASCGLFLLNWFTTLRPSGRLTASVIAAILGTVLVDHSPPPEVAWPDETVVLSGVVVSGPIESGRDQRFEVEIDEGELPGSSGSVKVCVSAPVSPKLRWGDQIEVTGHVIGTSELSERTAGYLRSRACSGSVSAMSILLVERGSGPRALLDGIRRELTAGLHRVAPGDTGALMSGLVTGDDAAISNDRRDAFITTGTSHVSAVSGSNLAIIVTIMVAVGSLAGRQRSRGWAIATVAGLWLYVGVIGVQPPALRAALVATVAIFGLIFLGRRPDFITISVLVAAIQIAIRPDDFQSLAYRLSTVSAIALVLGLAGRSPKGVRGWLLAGIIATAVTQAATSPLLIPTFGRISLYAIPANLVIAPLCSIAFPFALVASIVSIFSSDLAIVVAAPGTILSAATLTMISSIAKLPGADTGGGPLASAAGWLLAIGAIIVVLAASSECRGGLRRRAREIAAFDPRTRAVTLGAVGGAFAGTILGLFVR